MSDSGDSASGGSPRSVPRRPSHSTQPIATARSVAGSRRYPTDGSQPTAPRWLQVAGGWSWRLIVVTAVIVGLFYATAQVQLVFIAVFVALVFTAVLRPVTEFYAKIMNRFVAAVLSILTGIIVLGGVITYVTVSVVAEWDELAVTFAEGLDRILAFFQDGPLPITVTAEDIEEMWDAARTWLTEHAGVIASTAFSQIGVIAWTFMILALAVFCCIFFLARGQAMWSWFLSQLPENARQSWHTAGGAGWYTFSGFARGTVIIAFCNGVLAAILLTILGVPLVGPLALLVFIGTFIPLIGAPAAMVIAIVVAFAANGILNAALVGVGIALIGQLEGNVLQPLIMGKQVSLHPVVVALAVTAGTLTAGILGAIIIIPLVAVAWAVFSQLRTHYSPVDLEELEPFDPDRFDKDPAVETTDDEVSASSAD